MNNREVQILTPGDAFKSGLKFMAWSFAAMGAVGLAMMVML